jgi:capsular polysaccharide biosynthesis protein
MRLAVRPAYTALPQPTAAAGSLDVMTILKAFRRCWPLAVGLGLVCALAATAAAWFLLPAAKYNATATLRIISYQPRIIFPTNEPQADPFTYQQTQMALIKSRMVLDAALRDPKISGLKTVQEKEDPVEWLEKDLGVQSRPNSMVITIGLSGERPGDLAALVNAVTEKYQRLVVEAERQQRFERLDYLRKLWTRYQDELRQKRKTLREMVEAGHTANQNVVELENQFLLDAIQAARS